MDHDFLLLKKSEYPYENYEIFLEGSEGRIYLHDDLVQYMGDTLNWVPSMNPSNPSEWPGYGLNLFGPTVIHTSGAEKFGRVCTAWADLMSLGPKNLHLTGSFEWVPEEIATEENKEGKRLIEDGSSIDENIAGMRVYQGYSKIRCDRDELVGKLRLLAEYAQKALDGDHYILHLGI